MKSKNYKAIDIACYIINKTVELYGGITLSRVQSLLYFVQVYSIIFKGRVCFTDSIRAYPLSVNIEEVYNNFKHWGNLTNTSFISVYGVFNTKFDVDKIKQEDKEIILEVIDIFSGYDDETLFKIITCQDTWKDAIYTRIGTDITIESIIKFFR